MGQVWSKASFDGTNQTAHLGGRGSVLAVTSQNRGEDEQFGTSDDVLALLNSKFVSVSIDAEPNSDCQDALDRVRGFNSFHPGGAYFLFGDGSVQFISETIQVRTYRALSTIASGETDLEF